MGEAKGATSGVVDGSGVSDLLGHFFFLDRIREGTRVCVATALPWRILVSFMAHLFIRRSCGPFYVDRLYAERFAGGLSRHIRVRFSAVLASANSAATFLSPRIRNRRIPRCSFKTPMTASANAFRRRYDARPVVEANLLRMRRRAG